MKAIAESLLDIEAVSLRPQAPFTWASGIKSPIYCDNRLTLSYPKTRQLIEDSFVKLIETHFPTANYIMGTATAGIPHAALIADKMGLPMGFVRSSNKDHGKGNKIEGAVIPGAKVVVIEDLISTGGSSIEAAKALEAAGFEVLGVAAIFSYLLDNARQNFDACGYVHVTLTDFEELTEVALDRGIISKDAIDGLNRWRKDPSDESWIG
ncbi:orotate phosphoribosyltransferase [Peptoniphilus equinus]|uniref:Orotate phosphoribosyltransferase n=1 Tax=Peptoniphilus equinus TaxID=3016343 RepID=A0ABY7QRS1_9FIRM|nr:orotate phosphoribosyltransferase [Peptoniphilus equinus]WBW49489.1 orotate phosphoribosyltransferase [Peptoniphilus equinus]